MPDSEFPVQLPRDMQVFAAPHWLVGDTPAWIEHIPFAFWLMSAALPRTLVELGTHYGNSYFAFAQASRSLEVPCAMFAVDTWAGDEHSGMYGEEVFEAVAAHSRDQYGSFSNLVRSTFDEAVDHFEDGEIDLLHIDGHHTYESVKHDFGLWQPKMSERGVVLFHDIAVRERGFGVYQLWVELSSQFPAFSFQHGNGLGVLGLGAALPTRVRSLLELRDDSPEARAVRQVFGSLGRGLSEAALAQLAGAASRAEAGVEIAAVRAEAGVEIAAVRAEAVNELEELDERHQEDTTRVDVEHARRVEALRYEASLADQRAVSALDRRIAAAIGDTSVDR